MSEHEQDILKHLPLVKAPGTIWASIEAALGEHRAPERPARHPWRWAFAAVAVLALLITGYWTAKHGSAGGWIETDSRSHATIRIGDIGSVEVEPGSRVRVIAERPSEHRLALARGEIRAKISAPPKLFFVDTAAGTAIDLGCEYSMSTDEDGTGWLRVTKGWVSFQW